MQMYGNISSIQHRQKTGRRMRSNFVKKKTPPGVVLYNLAYLLSYTNKPDIDSSCLLGNMSLSAICATKVSQLFAQ